VRSHSIPFFNDLLLIYSFIIIIDGDVFVYSVLREYR